jgi:hypothetical protein
MSIEISEVTIARETKCKNAFSCLSGMAPDVCEVGQALGGGLVLFVKKNTSYFCPYAGRFGTSYVCSCPVRRELYSRYGI